MGRLLQCREAKKKKKKRIFKGKRRQTNDNLFNRAQGMIGKEKKMTKQATCPLQRQVPNTAPSFSHSGAQYKSLSWFSQLTTGGKRLKKKKIGEKDNFSWMQQ